MSTDMPSEDFASQYTKITKQIVMQGIELERFSLHYHLEAFKRRSLESGATSQPKRQAYLVYSLLKLFL